MPPFPSHLEAQHVSPLAPFLRAGVAAALWNAEGTLAWTSAKGLPPETPPDLKLAIADLLAAVAPGGFRMAQLPIAGSSITAACLHAYDRDGAPALLAALLQPLRPRAVPAAVSPDPVRVVRDKPGAGVPASYGASRISLDWLGAAESGARRPTLRRLERAAEEQEARELGDWAAHAAARFGEAMNRAALMAGDVLGRLAVSAPRPGPGGFEAPVPMAPAPQTRTLALVPAGEPAERQAAPPRAVPAQEPAAPNAAPQNGASQADPLQGNSAAGNASASVAGRRRDALSENDRQTLREIARALGGAPAPSAVDSPPGPSSGQAAIPAEPPGSAAAPIAADSRDAALLDALPTPILVKRAGRAIHANRALLVLTGAADLPAAERAGLHALPPGAASALVQTPAGPALMRASASTGLWEGAPAEFVALVPAERSADERGVRELTAILDTATDGVVVLSEAGRIISLNRSAQALFGYESEQVRGQPFVLLFATASHPLAIDYLEGLRSNGVASILNDGREVTGRVRQGGELPLFLTLGLICEGAERKFCAVLRDLTAWKKAESELLEAKRTAEISSSHKSDFLAAISHEIRTPLNAVIGFAELMVEERFGPIGNQRYKDYLRDIRASGAHVISLVNDLLDLAKIEAGRMELDFTAVDLNEVARGSTTFLHTQAARERIVLRSSLSPGLPAVVGDERSLRQVMLNILSNAVKFTEPGGQVIISTALTDRGEVALRVRDTGIGMTQDELKAALEPFRRIATSRNVGGTGLGLPLTRALVEANRAALSITSEKGEGTLVEIVFPAMRVLAN